MVVGASGQVWIITLIIMMILVIMLFICCRREEYRSMLASNSYLSSSTESPTPRPPPAATGPRRYCDTNKLLWSLAISLLLVLIMAVVCNMEPAYVNPVMQWWTPFRRDCFQSASSDCGWRCLKSWFYQWTADICGLRETFKDSFHEKFTNLKSKVWFPRVVSTLSYVDTG